MIKNYVYHAFMILLIQVSCTNKNQLNNQVNMDEIKNISQNKWDQLSQQKIYFGHQSVGYNMIDGMEVILKENPNIKLDIKKGKDPNLFKDPVFAHDNNGSNRDPKSKINNFYDTVQKIGSFIDIAGFKFCYVDFEKGTDVNMVFKYYKQKMDSLSLEHPDIIFVHYTIPLKSLQGGSKGFFKKLLGKDIGIEDNIIRNEFNDLLRNEYQTVFDIADIESTYPDGKKEFTKVHEKKIYTMVPSYTIDSGHLSSTGKIVVASKFISYLASLKINK